jgi:hypothetical protein
LGIVFHGMHPSLAHSFDSPVNVGFLETVKSELAVDSVFRVVWEAPCIVSYSDIFHAPDIVRNPTGWRRL